MSLGMSRPVRTRSTTSPARADGARTSNEIGIPPTISRVIGALAWGPPGCVNEWRAESRIKDAQLAEKDKQLGLVRLVLVGAAVVPRRVPEGRREGGEEPMSWFRRFPLIRPRRQRSSIRATEATRARQRAEVELVETRKQTAHYRALAESLREIRDRNRFADAIERTFRGDHA
jgi:hypothetical protein